MQKGPPKAQCLQIDPLFINCLPIFTLDLNISQYPTFNDLINSMEDSEVFFSGVTHKKTKAKVNCI